MLEEWKEEAELASTHAIALDNQPPMPPAWPVLTCQRSYHYVNNAAVVDVQLPTTGAQQGRPSVQVSRSAKRAVGASSGCLSFWSARTQHIRELCAVYSAERVCACVRACMC
jgi:hypothetical protein